MTKKKPKFKLEIEDEQVIRELKAEYPIRGSWDYFIMCLLVAWKELTTDAQKASIGGNLLGWSLHHNDMEWSMEQVIDAVYKR